MSFDKEQQRVISEVKEKFKIMNQIVKLQKVISGLEKKLELLKSKMSDLIKLLDEKNHPDKNSSVKGKAENGKSEDPSVLFTDS